jgi:hypothetical protein
VGFNEGVWERTHSADRSKHTDGKGKKGVVEEKSVEHGVVK